MGEVERDEDKKERIMKYPHVMQRISVICKRG